MKRIDFHKHGGDLCSELDSSSQLYITPPEMFCPSSFFFSPVSDFNIQNRELPLSFFR